MRNIVCIELSNQFLDWIASESFELYQCFRCASGFSFDGKGQGNGKYEHFARKETAKRTLNGSLPFDVEVFKIRRITVLDAMGSVLLNEKSRDERKFKEFCR